MSEGMVYVFKPGAHVPEGVTPDGVRGERDRIERDWGKATIDNSVEAVIKDPDDYPNLRAFGPADEEDAMRQGIARGIRAAYQAITVKRVNKEQSVRYVRVIHSVRDEEGDLVYKPIQAIRDVPEELKYLVETLQRDALRYHERMQDTLAEIKEAL